MIEGPACIAAPGPSLLQHLDEIRTYRTIIAVKRAHDILIDAGIVPTYGVTRDDVPERLARAFRTRHPDVRYVVAGPNGKRLLGTQTWLRRYTRGHSAKLGSADYAIAFARLKGATELHLYGFDNYSKGERFAAQRAAWTDTVMHVH